MNTIQLVTAILDAKISPAEVPYLRGNMIRLSGNHPLFHNHQPEGFRYAYPLVQYKRIDGCAAVVGIDRGGMELLHLLGSGEDIVLQLGNRMVEVGKTTFSTEKVQVVCTPDEAYTYSIRHWLPLNGRNYQLYLQQVGLTTRIAMLEKILVGNIISFAKGMGIFFKEPVMCCLLELESEGLMNYKGVELMDFSAKFRCNVLLPEHIGLGKAVSTGYGIIKRIKY